jgi:tRNA 5-methylaminomethyl-2-thiouridine biosynthesis bifunctional protein
MLRARHAPHHRATPPPGRRFGSTTQDVAIVGAGLAGAATARALAALGIRSTVFEARAAVAQAGSGQPAGLLHGVVHAEDSPHTRWFRAAALRAHASIAPLIAQRRVAGRLDGLLRIERELDHVSMVALLHAQGLPLDYVQALSADKASERAGCAIGGPAWLYAGGGWVDPAALVGAWLDDPLIELRFNTAVDRLAQDAHGRWQLRDASGQCLATSAQLVLASAGDFARLVADEPWPLLTSRGQVTLLPAAADWRPAMPVAGDGYAIALPHDRLLCGAASDLDDATAELRDADHRRNLAALQRLSGRPWSDEVQGLGGRVAWRVHARDRLPLLGQVPLPLSQRTEAARQEQARFIARRPGLHVLAALGSRGLTQAALAGEVVAAMIAGSPLPAGSALLDAVDAARFAARAARTGQ